MFSRLWLHFRGTNQIFLLCKIVFGGDRRTQYHMIECGKEQTERTVFKKKGGQVNE